MKRIKPKINAGDIVIVDYAHYQNEIGTVTGVYYDTSGNEGIILGDNIRTNRYHLVHREDFLSRNIKCEYISEFREIVKLLNTIYGIQYNFKNMRNLIDTCNKMCISSDGVIERGWKGEYNTLNFNNLFPSNGHDFEPKFLFDSELYPKSVGDWIVGDIMISPFGSIAKVHEIQGGMASIRYLYTADNDCGITAWWQNGCKWMPIMTQTISFIGNDVFYRLPKQQQKYINSKIMIKETDNKSEDKILICGTCDRIITKNETAIDDGIEEGVYHHNYCY